MKTNKINTNVPNELSAQFRMTIASACSASEMVSKAYVRIRDFVVGTRRDADAAKALREYLYSIVLGRDGVNDETAKDIIGRLMRADGLRQRSAGDANNGRMDEDKRDIVGKIMGFIDSLEETKSMSPVEKFNLCQSVGRQYKKATATK